MSEPERVSRKPPNTGFKQQRLKSWQPLLTPKSVLPTLFILGAIFTLLGVPILFWNDGIAEISIDYTDCITAGDQFTPIKLQNFKSSLPTGNSQLMAPKYKSTIVPIPNNPNKLTTPQCTIRFEVSTNVEGPVFLYYQLTNFYQNHRSYVKSLSWPQLKGTDLGDYTTLNSSCDPLGGKLVNGVFIPYYPCGLIANSVFNDTISPLSKFEGDNSNYTFDETGISWEADKVRYSNNNYSLDQILPPPYWAGNYPNGTYTEEYPPPNLEKDEHLQVWFRTAGLPRFRKLYGRNMKDPLSAGKYQIDILDKYNITEYGGRKSIIISTRSVFGGKNPSLGFAYIALGAICVLAGIIFTARHIYKPRKLGDHTYLSWNQAKPARLAQ